MSMPPPIQPPPPPMYQQAPGVSVPNHLAWAIVVTIASLCLCCIFGTIPGIVAIVFASKVNSALDRGDFAEAQRSSATAKLWCWITTGLCALGLLASIGVFATGGMAQYTEQLKQLEAMQKR